MLFWQSHFGRILQLSQPECNRFRSAPPQVGDFLEEVLIDGQCWRRQIRLLFRFTQRSWSFIFIRFHVTWKVQIIIQGGLEVPAHLSIFWLGQPNPIKFYDCTRYTFLLRLQFHQVSSRTEVVCTVIEAIKLDKQELRTSITIRLKYQWFWYL